VRRTRDGDPRVETPFDDPHRVVAGARSPWARRRKLTLAELANEPWIFASNHVIRELMTEAFKAYGLEIPQERVTASSILLRNHLLATGHYLTVLPDSALRYSAKLWSLKALPVDLGVKPRSVAILTLKNRTLNPVVHLFIEQVRAVAKTMSARSGAASTVDR
jgi:DNA-binding transcriptional LysR family regulator